MKRFVYLGFLIIFISTVFILLVFEKFSSISIACFPTGCSDVSIFFTMLFGLCVMSAFVIIDAIVAYIIIKEKPWEMAEAYKRAETKNKTEELKELESEYENIKRSKLEAEKQYYKGKFDAETFKKMLDRYEQRMIEIKSKIKSLKLERKKAKKQGEK